MDSHQSPKLILILLPVLGLLQGCSPGPARVAQLYLDSSKVSTDAVKQYDKDSDGKLNKDELKAIPAIANTISQYDTDGDGHVNAAEIAARIDIRTQCAAARFAAGWAIVENGGLGFALGVSALKAADVICEEAKELDNSSANSGDTYGNGPVRAGADTWYL